MTNEKLAAAYLEKHVLGAAEAADIIWQSDGRVPLPYLCRQHFTDETSYHWAGYGGRGQSVRVHSVFPVKCLNPHENSFGEKRPRKTQTLDFSRLVEPVTVCLGYRIQDYNKKEDFKRWQTTKSYDTFAAPAGRMVR